MELLRLGSTGPNVEFLQSTLKKLGYYTGNIDGIFGTQTENAVKRFQYDFGLVPDGIVGNITLDALFPYINGYSYYVIKSGDTLYSIARYFGTDINFILVANPNLDVNNLRVGSSIIVPFGSIVPTNISYSYSTMDLNINALSRIYPFINSTTIGYSYLNKPLPCIRFGRGPAKVFYSASIHANEWITSVVLMKFLEDLCRAYVLNRNIYGVNARYLYNTTSIYIAPMINPDGVDLVTGYLKPGNENYESAKQISNNYPNIPFPSGWKANIRGVDLNLQFPAGWENAKEIKYAQGFTSPAPRDFVGYGPLTEPESLALYNFTLSNDFRLVLAYHTQGKEIYWQFQNYTPESSLAIGTRLANASGYTLADTPYNSSFAGYKDWFIQQFRRPGYTIEAGLGENPLPISQFNEIYRDNIGILVLAAILSI